jgi:hypothetical protein
LKERTQWRIEGTIIGASEPPHPPESDPTSFGNHAAAPPTPQHVLIPERSGRSSAIPSQLEQIRAHAAGVLPTWNDLPV